MRKPIMKALLAVGVTFGAFIVALLCLSGSKASSVSASTPPHATTPDTPQLKWDYETVTMDAGSKTEKTACIQSDNVLQFDFPYRDNPAQLCFRSDGSVIFKIASGQLLSGEDHGARIKIGDNPPRSFGLDEPDDDSSTAAFIVPAAPIFSAAKAGRKIAVEVTYYEAGEQAAIFSPNAPLLMAMDHRAPSKPKIPCVVDYGC